MAALIELLDYMDKQKQRDLDRQYTEVKMEAYRRSQNAAAVQEGKAMALRDNMTQAYKDIEAADMDLQRTQKQWFEARQKGQLSAEQNDLYRNAYANAQANAEMQKSKYRVLTMEKGHMDGSLDKTKAKAAEPMFGRIFDPKKDPYDQIEEERRSKTTDQATGTETEVIQKGPASAFGGGNAYAPQGEEDKFTAPATATSLLGFTPRGFDADLEAVTPEFSYQPVRNQGGMTNQADVAGVTEVDPASMTQSSDEKTEALNAYNSAKTPEAKKRIQQAAAANGIQIP